MIHLQLGPWVDVLFRLGSPQGARLSSYIVVGVDGVPVNEKVDDWARVSAEVADQLHEGRIGQPVVLQSAMGQSHDGLDLLQCLDVLAAVEHLEQGFHAVEIQSVAGATNGRWLFGLLLVETVRAIRLLLNWRSSEDRMQLDSVDAAKHSSIRVESALWLVLLHVRFVRVCGSSLFVGPDLWRFNNNFAHYDNII